MKKCYKNIQNRVLDLRGDPVLTEFLHVKSHKEFLVSRLVETFGGSCQCVYEDDRRKSTGSYTTGSEVKSQVGLVSNPRGHLGPFPCKANLTVAYKL